MQRPTNLNDLTIYSADGPEVEQVDYSYRSDCLDVYFKDIQKHLIDFIGTATHVLGCVAWLTDPEIIDALAKTSCSILVQKEDFLRPDCDSTSNFKRAMRTRYDSLKNKCVCRYNAPGALHMMSCAGDPTVAAVRAVGNHNRDRNPAFPRMHNKFLVACDYDREKDNLYPHSVWTGSFNFTKNAGMSFENAVVIRDQKVAHQYAQEWGQIAAFSEPLNWQSTWVFPEWRIGT